MSFTAIENTPIIVDLLAQTKDTGWTIDGDVATHVACNAGNIQLTGYNIIAGDTYQISYRIINISGGSLQMFAGDTAGISRTTAGDYVETILASGSAPILYFHSNANCQLKAFNLRNTVEDVSNTQKNTIVYSPVNNKWTMFLTMSPEYGFSMDIRTLIFQYGILYSQENGSTDRNTFFGVEYKSLFTFVENKNPAIVKSFQCLAIQGNQLMITTDNGIQTSLGQLSTLIDTDFIEQDLVDGNITVNIYDRYGVYMASFLNDENDDVVNGNDLKGNYIIVQLQSLNTGVPLQIFSVDVKSSVMHIGNR